jgi:hypothetical protein
MWQDDRMDEWDEINGEQKRYKLSVSRMTERMKG